MTGGFSWKSILEYVSSYNPLDSGIDSTCAGFASTGFALSALLSGYSTAKYGYLGYLVLFIQKQGKLGLRTSVIFANFQKGLGALFGVFLVYMAKFRMGLARMILYTYATFISGSQLLWVSRPSKGRYRRIFLGAQLTMLGAGYAGEGSTSYLFKTLITRTKGGEDRSTKTGGTARASITICVRGTNGTMTRPGCTCYQPDDRLVGCIGPATTARESCVCAFSGEQYNWKPHVCPILKEGAREGLCTCCYPESSCPERDNRGNSSVKDQKQKPVKNGPQDTEEEMDCVWRKPQRENARKRRNRIRKKLFAAKLLGTILGTVLAAVFSTEIFIKISTVVTIISNNLFFWMGAQCYNLGGMENDDTTDESESGQIEDSDNNDETESGQIEDSDNNDEENNDGKDEKRNSDALVPELKKAAEAVRKLLPLWLTFASTCYLVNATADSLFMEQVDYLENNTQSQSSKIPKSFFNSFPDIVSHITGQVSLYLIKQFDHEKKEQLDVGARWARLLRISIGMLFSSLCCIVASLVAYRLDSNYNSASMLWLLPQFLLWGMMKGILEEGLEEFLHDHIKNDLVVQAVSGVAESVGSWISTILTAASPSSWVGNGDDISESHLDKYYRMLAIITLFSTFLFTIVAIGYELRAKEKRR